MRIPMMAHARQPNTGRILMALFDLFLRISGGIYLVLHAWRWLKVSRAGS